MNTILLQRGINYNQQVSWDEILSPCGFSLGITPTPTEELSILVPQYKIDNLNINQKKFGGFLYWEQVTQPEIYNQGKGLLYTCPPPGVHIYGVLLLYEHGTHIQTVCLSIHYDDINDHLYITGLEIAPDALPKSTEKKYWENLITTAINLAHP